MTSISAENPAILGGIPVRPSGPPAWPRSTPSIRSALLDLIDSGDWGRYHGSHVPNLCRRLTKYFEIEHVLPCSSGTAAVELALRGAGVSENDEVILAGYDFKANFQNILCVRAVPVLVDVDPQTWQLDPSRIVSALSNRTRAILISHLHGGVVDARVVCEIAKNHGLIVIEDICQCPGARLYGKRAGTWGDVSVVSFGGSKLLTAGRGGAVLTGRTDVAERIKRYVQRVNEAYPLSEAQAAIVCAQIEELDSLNEFRGNAVKALCRKLADVNGMELLQRPSDEVLPVYYKVGFRYSAANFSGLSRSQFVHAMRAEGIAFDAGFRGLHLIHGSRRFRAVDELPMTNQADAGMLTLHHPVLLESDSALDEIVAAVEKVQKNAEEIRVRHQDADSVSDEFKKSSIF